MEDDIELDWAVRERRLAGDQLPEPIGRPLDLSEHKDTVKDLRRKVDEIAGELSVPSVLLSNKRTVEELVRRHLEGGEPVLPDALGGWREVVVGNPTKTELAEWTKDPPSR